MKANESRARTNPAIFASRLLVGLIGIGALAAAPANNEADRLRAEAGELKQKAQDLITQSQKLARAAEELDAQRGAPDQRVPEPRAGMKDELKALRRQLQEEADAGDLDGAVKTKQRIGELETRLAQSSRDDRVGAKERYGQLQTKIRALRETGRNEDADRLEQEARAIRAKLQAPQPEPARASGPIPGAGPAPRPLAEAGQRLEHLREAIGHLQAAGLNDVAEKLGREADRLQGEIPQAGGPRPPQPTQPPPPQKPRRAPAQAWGPPRPGNPRVAELTDQVQQLRRAVEELRHRLDDLAGQRR